MDAEREYSSVSRVRFQNICYAHNKVTERGEGIGTLGEKRLHRVLKDYFDPDPAHQELPYLGYIADIKNQSGIVEVQTGSLAPLFSKLAAFLDGDRVTLVHPMLENKTLSWIDPETGDISPRRKSPVHERPLDGLVDLYNIRSHLSSPNLSVRLVFLDVDEYKFRDGYGKNRTKGSHRYERIPISINSILCLDCPADYKALIPEEIRSLSCGFTAKEFASACKTNVRYAYYALTSLVHAGALEVTGKKGRAFLYALTSDE